MTQNTIINLFTKSMHLLELKINQLVFSRPFIPPPPPKKTTTATTQNTSPLIRVVIYFRDLLKEPPALLWSSAFFVYELIFLSLSLHSTVLFTGQLIGSYRDLQQGKLHILPSYKHLDIT